MVFSFFRQQNYCLPRPSATQIDQSPDFLDYCHILTIAPFICFPDYRPILITIPFSPLCFSTLLRHPASSSCFAILFRHPIFATCFAIQFSSQFLPSNFDTGLFWTQSAFFGRWPVLTFVSLWPLARTHNPQRHRIAEFAAVAEKGNDGNGVRKACRKGTEEKGCPQRHRIAGNAAVVAKRQRDNAVQKACRKGAEENGFPQRHRIAGNAAVAEKDEVKAKWAPTEMRLCERHTPIRTGTARKDRTGSYISGMIPSWSVRNCPYSSGEKT